MAVPADCSPASARIAAAADPLPDPMRDGDTAGGPAAFAAEDGPEACFETEGGLGGEPGGAEPGLAEGPGHEELGHHAGWQTSGLLKKKLSQDTQIALRGETFSNWSGIA